MAGYRQEVATHFQFGVAVYGGYFGAGIGILMLVNLGFLGLTNIHAMNGLKNFFGMSKPLDLLLTAAERDARVLAVLLYGSEARNEARSDSDTDVCLVLGPGVDSGLPGSTAT